MYIGDVLLNVLSTSLESNQSSLLRTPSKLNASARRLSKLVVNAMENSLFIYKSANKIYASDGCLLCINSDKNIYRMF